MIRALLASHGWTVVGDCRYGHHVVPPLPDHSVALHAATIELPSQLPLGNDATEDRPRLFVAPIPDRWCPYFGITQSHVQELLDLTKA